MYGQLAQVSLNLRNPGSFFCHTPGCLEDALCAAAEALTLTPQAGWVVTRHINRDVGDLGLEVGGMVIDAEVL